MPIRITGGDLRGRMVPSPPSMKTRPTGSRTREALFNILQSVDGFRMLDLFAGSGIMGIEALSRGASHVVVGSDFCFGYNRSGTVDTLRNKRENST